jgi:hypothetical protein
MAARLPFLLTNSSTKVIQQLGIPSTSHHTSNPPWHYTFSDTLTWYKQRSQPGVCYQSLWSREKSIILLWSIESCYNGEEKQQVHCTVQITGNFLHRKNGNQAAAHEFCVEFFFISTAVIYGTFMCEEESIFILDSQ